MIRRRRRRRMVMVMVMVMVAHAKKPKKSESKDDAYQCQYQYQNEYQNEYQYQCQYEYQYEHPAEKAAWMAVGSMVATAEGFWAAAERAVVSSWQEDHNHGGSDRDGNGDRNIDDDDHHHHQDDDNDNNDSNSNNNNSNSNSHRPWKGFRVVFTGSLGEGLTRSKAQDVAKQLGAKATPGSVSKSTDLVVYGDKGGKKLTQAMELGIPTIEANEFVRLAKEKGYL